MKTIIFKTPFFSDTINEVENHLKGIHEQVVSLVIVWDQITENWVATLTVSN